MHIDHIGWLAQNGAPWFPNATVLFGSADWRQFVEEAAVGDRGAAALRALDAAGRLAPLDGAMRGVATGRPAAAATGSRPTGPTTSTSSATWAVSTSPWRW